MKRKQFISSIIPATLSARAIAHGLDEPEPDRHYHIPPYLKPGQRDFTCGGTDAERAADFQAMLNDPEVHAIMCARGGYGFVRIIDRIDFSLFKKKPKWLIGFSDITVLHRHVSKLYGTVSIHSKMCNSFPSD